TEERPTLAVPDRVIDDEERRRTAIAVAFRHLAVEGLGALLQPLLGCSEKRDVVLRRSPDVARIVGLQTNFAQQGSDFRIVPKLLGEDARHAIGIWRRAHFLELVQAHLPLAEGQLASKHRQNSSCQEQFMSPNTWRLPSWSMEDRGID